MYTGNPFVSFNCTIPPIDGIVLSNTTVPPRRVGIVLWNTTVPLRIGGIAHGILLSHLGQVGFSRGTGIWRQLVHHAHIQDDHEMILDYTSGQKQRGGNEGRGCLPLLWKLPFVCHGMDPTALTLTKEQCGSISQDVSRLARNPGWLALLAAVWDSRKWWPCIVSITVHTRTRTGWFDRCNK